MSRQSEAIALCRVSTLEQRVEGHSLQRQEGNVYASAKELGVRIVKLWSIDQSSRAGKNIKRKDLKEMLEFCKLNKQVRYLIVDEVDRFMRSIQESYYYEQLFSDLGVKIYYASQPELNTGDQNAKFKKVLSILGAEMSNDERQRKTTGGMKSRVEAGYYPFNPHRGYKKTLTPGLHEPCPITFEIYQQAFISIASSTHSVREALLAMNARLASLGKVQVKIDKFVKMLEDKYYYGRIEISGWENYCDSGLHTAMITPDQYVAIQDALGHRTKRVYQRKQSNPEFPMAKILMCGECMNGAKFTGSFQSNGKGNRYPKYRCRGCGVQYTRDLIHSEMVSVLRKIQLPSTDKTEFIDALNLVWISKQAEQLKQLAAAKKRLQELQQTKESLILKSALSPLELTGDYTEMVSKIKVKIDAANEDIDRHTLDQEDLVEFVNFALSYIEELSSRWWELSAEKRQLCQLLIFPSGIYLYADKKVGTDNISPIFRLASNKKDLRESRKSLMVELEGQSWHKLSKGLTYWRELLLHDYQLTKADRYQYIR